MGPQTITDNQSIRLDMVRRKITLENLFKNGWNWFYIIAAASVVNSVIFLFGANLTLVIGLGITQVIDGVMLGVAQRLGADTGATFRWIGVIIVILVAGVFVAFARFSRQRHRRAFLGGMVLYAVDTILVVLFQAWLSVAFHVVALFGLWRGWQALNALSKLERELPTEEWLALQQVTLEDPQAQKRVRRTGNLILGAALALIILLGFFLLLMLPYLR